MIKYLHNKLFKQIPSIDGDEDLLIDYFKKYPNEINNSKVFYKKNKDGYRPFSTRGFVYEAIRFEKIRLVKFLINHDNYDEKIEHKIEYCSNIIQSCVLWKQYSIIEEANSLFNIYNTNKRMNKDDLFFYIHEIGKNDCSDVSKLENLVNFIENNFYKVSFRDIVCLIKPAKRKNKKRDLHGNLRLLKEDIDFICNFFVDKESLIILKEIDQVSNDKTVKKEIEKIENKINFKNSLKFTSQS